MSEGIFVEDASNPRSRRACSNCYEKKIKCDYNSELGICALCQKNKTKCEIPNVDAVKPRKSIRAAVEELESRVLSLEGYQGPMSIMATTPHSNPIIETSDPPQLPPDSSHNAADTNPLPNPPPVPLTRGTTSPWSVLISGTDDSNPALQSFRASATATADSESSHSTSNKSTSNNMLTEISGLTSSKVYEYARTYACVAPYPILHWDSLKLIVQSLNERHAMVPVGAASCVWIYMAFGAAHVMETRSDTIAKNEPGIYFEKGWKNLPQLLLNYDLWALKAVTLMIHYLQASEKPQACWALLGTALRLAASLGFDRADLKLGVYSEVEQEEGRRAFWLCHVMEKSLCINLGRSSSLTALPKVRTPQPFVPMTVDFESDIFGENEQDAATFFCEMIELAEVRDKIFLTLQSDQKLGDNSYQQLLSRLQTKSRSEDLNLVSSSAIRDCIYNLAYYNTLQVLATTQRQTNGRHVPEEAVISARKSLDLISETQKSGQLMCLWMWLYYAFTSAVVLFLHSVSNIHDRDTTLNLAAISDFEELCSKIKDVSEGAAQCMEIAKAMRVAIHKIAKTAGRKRGREAEDFIEGSSSKKIAQPKSVAHGGFEEPSSSVWQQSMAADPSATLAGAPANFEWDEWDKWLEDVNLAGNDGT